MDNNKQKSVCPPPASGSRHFTYRLCCHLDGNVVQSTITTNLSLTVAKQHLVVIHNFNEINDILLKKMSKY
jgi:hypothetical protein